MYGRLNRLVYWPLVALTAVTLWAIVLVLWPVAAWTQETANAPSDAAVVVDPGESFWSIAQEQLGPEATPGRVAEQAERIYELNGARIGDDPGMILPGQELVLPRTGGPSAAVRSPSVAEEQETGDAASRRAGAETVRPAVGGLAAPGLPVTPEVAPVPAVGSASPGTASLPVETARSTTAVVEATYEAFVGASSTVDERRQSGLILITLTLVVGALMTRTLSMRRQVAWGPGVAYAGACTGFDGSHEVEIVVRAGMGEPDAHAGVVKATRQRRLRRGPWAKRRPPKRPAGGGAYGSKGCRSLPHPGPKNRSRRPRTRNVGFRQKGGARR